MKYLLLTLCSLVLYFPFAFGQAPENTASVNEAHTGMVYTNNSIQIKAKRKVVSYKDARQAYNNIKGSPYLHKDKHPSVELIMNTDEVVENVTIQYDCYQNEIIANKGDQKEILLETAFIKRIESPSGEMEYPLERPNRENPNKFYEILYQDSTLTFFKDTKAELINHTRNIPGMHTTEEKFVRLYTYYLVKGKRVPVEINLKKDDIFRMIPRKNRTELKTAMTALKIKRLKSEDDYVRAFNYSPESVN